MKASALALVELRNGHLSRPSSEALGVARSAAVAVGGGMSVAVFGGAPSAAVEDLAALGAEDIHVFGSLRPDRYATEPFSRALATLIEETEPEVVVFGGSALGRDLAPRVAGRLGAGLVTECVVIDVAASGRMVARRLAYGGRLLQRLTWERSPRLMLVRAGVESGSQRPLSRGRGTVVPRPTESAARARVVGYRPTGGDGAAQRPDLSEARIVVAAGRGLGSPDKLPALAAVAEALGAAMGASRAVVDAGWLDHVHQVGQTGHTVTPDLYLACGISGAIQHLAGMSGARVVVAINRDPEAPIFQAADYGIVGDLGEILPLLSETLRPQS